jgi:hypothetical protein
MAFVGSVSVTVIVALFWLASLFAQLEEEGAQQSGRIAGRPGPFQELSAAVSLFTKESAAAFHELKSLLSAADSDK